MICECVAMRDSRRLVGGGGWVRIVGPDVVAGPLAGAVAAADGAAGVVMIVSLLECVKGDEW